MPKDRSLPREVLASRLDYNPATGALTWRATKSKRMRSGDEAGYVHPFGHVVVNIDGRKYLGHQIAWCLQTGRWPTFPIKFRNGRHDDLRFANLYSAVNVYSQKPAAIAARERTRRYREAARLMREDLAAAKAWAESIRTPAFANIVPGTNVKPGEDTSADAPHWEVRYLRHGRPVTIAKFDDLDEAEAFVRETDANKAWIADNPQPVPAYPDARAGVTPVALREFLAAIAYNPETGAIMWLADEATRGVRADKPNTTGNRVVQLYGRKFPAKSLAWFMTHGVWPEASQLRYREPRQRGRSDENRLSNLYYTVDELP